MDRRGIGEDRTSSGYGMCFQNFKESPMSKIDSMLNKAVVFKVKCDGCGIITYVSKVEDEDETMVGCLCGARKVKNMTKWT